MCVVSMIYDYGRGINPNIWTKPILDDYKKLIEKAKEWDIKTKQPDCDDKNKLAWLEKVEDYLNSMKDKAEKEKILKELMEEYDSNHMKEERERMARRDAKVGKMVSTLGQVEDFPLLKKALEKKNDISDGTR
jgi:hypothetical protein